MRLLDTHSHILPCMDDGAQNIEESVQLLKALKSQGVTDVIATPHFSLSDDSLEEYKRDLVTSKKLLAAACESEDLPNVFYGCEVLYSFGMGALHGIDEFTIENSKYMLLEFGISRFDRAVCADIIKIKEESGITPIVAHIERYKDAKDYENLLDLVKMGVCKAQVNANSLIKNYFTKSAYKLIKRGLVDYIGSDCHSVDKRPPKVKEGYAALAEKTDKETAIEFIKNGEKLIYEIENSK